MRGLVVAEDGWPRPAWGALLRIWSVRARRGWGPAEEPGAQVPLGPPGVGKAAGAAEGLEGIAGERRQEVLHGERPPDGERIDEFHL